MAYAVELLRNMLDERSETREPIGGWPDIAQFEKMLDEEGPKLYDTFVQKLKADSTITRLYLRDILDEKLYRYFSGPASWWYLRTMRQWMSNKFGDRIQVEGDPRYAGYYFEFA